MINVKTFLDSHSWVELQAAINAMEDNDLLYFASGNNFTFKQDLFFSKSITVFGYGATLIEDGGSLKFEGNIYKTKEITEPLKRNGLVLKVSNTTSLNQGDDVIVTSELSSEFLTISSVRDATTLVTEEYFTNSLPLEFIDNSKKLNIKGSTNARLSIFKPISVKILGLTFKSANSDNNHHLRIKYGRDCLIKDCIFTGEGKEKLKGLHVKYSQRVTFQNCTFRNLLYSGLYIARSAFIKVDNCHFENCNQRPLLLRFCNQVTLSNNAALKNAGFIFCVEGCYLCTIVNNQIHQVPRLYSEARETATSRPGIFVLGSENVVVAHNQLTNCIGEGSIYVRRSNYWAVPSPPPKKHPPGIHILQKNEYFLPTKNIIISQNTIQDELSDLASNHVAAIYMKSSGENIKVEGNVIHSKTGGIVLFGKYKKIDLLNNTIYSTGLGIRFDTIGASNGYANEIRIIGNTITSTEASNNKPLIALRLDENPRLQLLDNSIRLSNQTDSNNRHLITLRIKENNEDTSIGSGQIMIAQNMLKSDGRNRRALLVKIKDDPERLLMTNNLIDVPRS